MQLKETVFTYASEDKCACAIKILTSLSIDPTSYSVRTQSIKGALIETIIVITGIVPSNLIEELKKEGFDKKN